jgi:hypothetical protein
LETKKNSTKKPQKTSFFSNLSNFFQPRKYVRDVKNQAN